MFRSLPIFLSLTAVITTNTACTKHEPPSEGSSGASLAAQASSTSTNKIAGGFGTSCTSVIECDSGVCFVGGKGGFCTVKCAEDKDCAASSRDPHCNPHGYCRAN